MSRVVIVQCHGYHEADSCLAWGLSQVDISALKKKRVLLKPNVLIGRPPEDCVCTHPKVLHSLLDLFPWSVYGDSPAARTPQRQNMEMAGYALSRWVEFSHPESIDVPRPMAVEKLAIAKAVLDAPAVISVCKLKTHGYMHMTGALKNQYGCIVGRAKTRYHNLMPGTNDFAKLVCDINKVVRPSLYIMDAVDAMEGPGPFKGTPKHLGYILISTDPVALDAAACDLIDMPYSSVPTLKWGEIAGLGYIAHEKVGQPWKPDPTFDCNRNPPSDMTRGWLERHLNILTADYPAIDKEMCTRCGRCVDACPAQPVAAKPPRIDTSRCIRCYCCQEVCPQGAVSIKSPWLSRMVMAYRKARGGH